MTRTLRIIAVLGTLLVVAPALAVSEEKKQPKAPTDKEQLQGTWKIASVEVNGNLEKEDVDKTLTFNGDKLLPQGLEEAKFTLRLDPDKKPKEFDLIDEGKVILKGIYKLDDNTLTACYVDRVDHAQERPTEFSGAKGRNLVLLTAKRDQGKQK